VWEYDGVQLSVTGGARDLLWVTMEAHSSDCGCAQCGNDRDFALPEHLLDKIRDGEIVLFAGAGISTENKDHCSTTFYEDVRTELGIAEELSFPALMDAYCTQPDGRIKLIEKIKSRFDYFRSFDDFYLQMTRFHRAISPLYMIRDIVTTNWDDFFERVCGIDAFVYDGDMAFWDTSPRRLMKIHGSISNFGSIVATSDDYRNSFNRLNDGPLGGQLKSLIAKKTVIYVGYSLSDENYLRILLNIAKMMGRTTRQSYFISPYIDQSKLSSAPIPLTGIETDGAYFFETVKKRLIEEHCVVPDGAFESCDSFLYRVAIAHEKTADAFLRTHHPLLPFALSYQDGLIHALQRIARQRKTGEYHAPFMVHSRVHGYDRKLSRYLEKSDFWNASYALGYQAGLLLLLVSTDVEPPATPPLFDFPFRANARSLTAVLRLPKSRVPKRVSSQFRKMMRGNPGLSAGLIPDHTPYL
jgi:NAD-dependent SIR2 family protein deacetylase